MNIFALFNADYTFFFIRNLAQGLVLKAPYFWASF